MFVYRNKNTGDVVPYEHRSPRLDMLPNWELLEEPSTAVEEESQTPGPEAPQEPQAPDPQAPGAPSPHPQEPHEQGDGGTSPEKPPGGGGGDGDGPDVAERPARSASKSDWQAYARGRAQDSDEEAAIDGLTKDQLIEQYGGDN